MCRHEFVLIYLICEFFLLNLTRSIVNPNNHTANYVIMLQEPDMPLKQTHIWLAGVNCIDEFSRIFFYRRNDEKYTRAYNMVLTHARNMSMPAAHIQSGFMKRINEAVSMDLGRRSKRKILFQLRVVSDRIPYKRAGIMGGELLLADYYVMIVDNVERLQTLLRDYLSKMASWNPGARFIVLYNNPAERSEPIDTAIEIFNELMQNFYVHRVALLYAVQATQYNLLVNDYYSDVNCRVMQVQSIGACHDGQFYPNEQSVATAMMDYIYGFSPQNCTFYVCAAVAAPFVETDCQMGIEMRMLGFMRNRLNFAINQTCDKHETRGVVDKSGNWTGLLGKLTAGACDFVMGGFYPDNDVVENFWTSDCYLADSHTWFVKLAERRSPWKAMVAIFDFRTWLAFLLVLVISWLSWYALNTALPEPAQYQELALTGINALAVSLCISVNERPICYASRIFFLALAIYGLNVVCIYTSKMISTFQNPGFLHQIDTIEEVIAAGIPFGGSEESRDWFENEEDMWIFNAYNDTEYFEASTENLLEVKRGKRVILSNRMYILQNQLSDDIYAFPYNIFSSPMQMIMKAGFPFLIEMNTIIRNMRDVGIFHKIDADFRYNNTYLNRISRMRPKFQELVIVLTTDHLQGPFAILIVGISCASLTFAAEHIIGCSMSHPRAKVTKRKRNHTKRKRASRKIRRHMHFPKGYSMRELRFTPLARRKVLHNFKTSHDNFKTCSQYFTLNFIKNKNLLSAKKFQHKTETKLQYVADFAGNYSLK